MRGLGSLDIDFIIPRGMCAMGKVIAVSWGWGVESTVCVYYLGALSGYGVCFGEGCPWHLGDVLVGVIFVCVR